MCWSSLFLRACATTNITNMGFDNATTSGSGSELFDACYRQHSGVSDAVMLCITQKLHLQQQSLASNVNTWMAVLAGAIIFIMQLGFAMLCAGAVRRKNVSNTLLKNLLDACGAAIAWFACGYAFAFGGDNPDKGFTFLGSSNFFLTGTVSYSSWFFQYTFSAAAVTVIAGTLAGKPCVFGVDLWMFFNVDCPHLLFSLYVQSVAR